MTDDTKAPGWRSDEAKRWDSAIISGGSAGMAQGRTKELG